METETVRSSKLEEIALLAILCDSKLSTLKTNPL